MSAELYAAGRLIGHKCFDENFEFMKCKTADGNPTACVAQGEGVHACVYGLYKEISAKAPKQFSAFAECLDTSGLRAERCKPYQAAFEKAFYNA